MTVTLISLGCGQNETFEDVILEKHWTFWTFYNQRINQENNPLINPLWKYFHLDESGENNLNPKSI